MVPLVMAPSSFEAKVLAARLGAEGILWELRGGVDSLYPVGDISVLVDEADLERARDLLLVTEVDSAFEPEDEPAGRVHGPHRFAAVLALVVIAAFAVLRVLTAVPG
jgi:hypothetical protein